MAIHSPLSKTMRTLILSVFFAVTMIGQTKNDLFLMAGSSFFRPGLVPKSAFNLGYGYLPDKLKDNKFVNELTVGYTYENCGSGFWPTGNGGCHTPAIGAMRNIDLSKKLTFYAWVQAGMTGITGGPAVAWRFYSGYSAGTIYKLSHNYSVWTQVTLNKVVTAPIYPNVMTGLTKSW